MRKRLKQRWKKLAKRSTAYFLVFAMVVSVFSTNMETGFAKETPVSETGETGDGDNISLIVENGAGTGAGTGNSDTGNGSGSVGTDADKAGTNAGGGTDGSSGDGTDGTGGEGTGTKTGAEGTDGEGAGNGTDESGSTGTGSDGSGAGNTAGDNNDIDDGAESPKDPEENDDAQDPEEASPEEEEDVSSNDPLEEEEEIPPFEIMDLNAYGSMRNMLYAYALTYAEEGSLQEKINRAVEEGKSECTLTLDSDRAENLVILDDIKVTLNLNDHTLTPSVRIYNGSMSLITVYGELVLNGEGSLARGGMDDVRGITVGDGGCLVMNGGTIKDFQVEGNGAGVLVENKGSCVINGGTFTNNTAKYYGGGLFAYDAASTTLAGGRWENNRAECGGGIAFNKASGGSFSFQDLTVENNKAGENGGGIYVENAMKGVTLKQINVEENTAKIGGGMYFANGAEMSMAENGNVTINKNHATAGRGGGIWLGEGSGFTMTAGNRITGNIADGVKGVAGGGIYVYRSSTFTMTGGEISGNNALTSGGGVALSSDKNYGSTFIMSGGTVKENTVGQESVVQSGLYGGGIYVGSWSQGVTISGEAEISGNSGASHGGGIYIGGSGTGFLLEGGEIHNNTARTNNVDTYGGGGIYCSTVTKITGGKVYGNTAGYDGGGAYLGTVQMTGGEIYQNKAGRDGGGVRSGAFTMSDTALIYENTSSNHGGGIYSAAFTMNDGAKIYGNKSSGGGGGVAANGFATINGGEIYENTASQSGGGIYNWQGFRITGGSIYENTASTRGGGIATENGYRCYMTGGTVRNNRAGSNGGGISIYRGCLEMSGGEVSGNSSTASSGGGIYVYSAWNVWRSDCSGERLKISGNARITGNTAYNSGGGVGAEWGSVTISGGEITGNTALGKGTNTGYGGGIYVASSVSKFMVTGGVVKDNVARRKGTDIYGTCAYRYDGSVYKERLELEICAAANMGGASTDSYWLDENAADDNNVLTESIDNEEFRKSIKVIFEENKPKNEEAESQGLSQTYAYTFYEKQEGIAAVDDELYPSVQAAVTAVQNSDEKAKNKVITLLGDNRETVVIPEGVVVTLDLSGHVLKGELSSVIEVQEGAKLTIRDSSKGGNGEIREGKGKSILCADGKTIGTFGGGLYVAGEVVLESGSVKNNEATYGGGIYLSKHGVLTMNGGLVTENTGRGVTVYDYRELGALADVDARFTLNDGEISRNSIGGITTYNNVASKAEIIMTGGVISNHSASSNDGTGVWLKYGSFKMTGGEIRENTSLRGAIYGNSATVEIKDGRIIGNKATHGSWGGGALCFENYCNCKISGDTVISQNTALNGGAVYASNTTFTMEGGRIQNNTATGTGGALWVNGYSKITIGGNAAITGNKASGTAGGVYYNTSSNGNNAWFKLTQNAAVYGNETTLHPSDLYFIANSNILELPRVEDMDVEGEEYVCWFDYISHESKEVSDITVRKNMMYDLAASTELIEGGDVCQIRTGEKDEDGEQIIKKYASFAAAVADARTMTPADGEEIVIELLTDDHEESTEIPSGLKVTVDLGEHTLKPVKSDYTFYVRNGGNLTVKNGTIVPGEDMETSRGIRVAGGSDVNNLAVLAMESVTLEGFQGNTYGGGIYATGYWGIDLDQVTIRNCSATERGGGIYANRTGQYFVGDFTMKSSTVTGCSAKEYGGGVYVYVGWASQNKDLYGIRQITFDHCEITDNHITGSYGGGLYIGVQSNNAYVYLNVLNNTLISGNSAKSLGGGAYIEYLNKTYFTDVEVTGNQSTNGANGALRINNILSESRTVEMTNVNVHHNTSNGGGAAGASITSTATIRNSKFNDNQVLSASNTGGLSIAGKITVIDSEICRNSAMNGGGVGIANASADYPVIFENVKIEDNHARSGYGGIRIDQTTHYRHFTFENCSISGNTSSNGPAGGLGFFYDRRAIIDFIGTTVSGNSSSGDGGGLYFRNDDVNGTQVTLKEGTVIESNTAGGAGGGICMDGGYSTVNRHTLQIEEGASIRGNTAVGNGGGICAGNSNVIMGGGEILDNAGNYGGGIFITYRSWTSNSVTYRANGSFKMTGGRIDGNTAKLNGGGVYVDSYCDDEIEISGGEITGNRAEGKGGGIAQSANGAHVQLLAGGKVYDNEASLGQDVYGNYVKDQVSYLNLIPAEDMFEEEDESHKGVGWFDEKTNEIIITEIQGKLARYYALTLLYDNGETVAMIGDTGFTSVQKAVDALQEGNVPLEEGQIPEIRMVKDSVENVAIPGEMTVVLNLNGKTLRGHSTAISCQGNLTIVDKKEPGVTTTGTITGFGVEAGGGVHVLSGGRVTMKSGQISGCYGSTYSTTDNTGEKGGAAVCVEAGTFILEGGSLNHNNATCGAAVLVRNNAGKFRMLGGIIEENTGNYGAVFVKRGSAEIAGGEIRNNTMAKNGGGVYISSGTLSIIGRDDNKNKVMISGNSAGERGGGIYINDGSVSLKNVDITENRTTAARSSTDVSISAGGGIYANVGRLDIGAGTSIMNNSAVRGGGIYQRSSGTIHMVGGLISKNTAQMGGGVAQYPNAVCKFLLMGGGVYDNLSRLSASGNDFYSRYEGTDPNYGKNSVVPQLTLINAASMGNKNYNAWKDDAYIKTKGDEDYARLGELIGEGQYIIADITMSYNVELTAAHYETEIVKTDLLTDMEVGSITLTQSTQTGTESVTTGTNVWDSDAATKESEKTAAEMHILYPGIWELSKTTYGEENLAYIEYTGDDPAYAGDHGNGPGLYERNQIADWTPGNDSNKENTLVRTFDRVTYPFTVTMQKTEKETGKTDVSGNDISEKEEEEISPDAYYRLWIEVRLPADTDKADFVTGGKDAFSSMKHYIMETELDEQGNSIRVMRGYWDLKGEDYKQGGNYGDSISIQIYGMQNGDTIKPSFRCWMEGTEEVEKGCESDRLTVSAAAKYNVTLDYNSALSYTSYFDTARGVEASEKEMETNENVVYGTMLGYGVTVELYNDNTAKGLKGIELPADGVEFDLRFKGSLHMDGEPILDENGKAVAAAPYIWAYKENESGDLGKTLGGTTYSRNMNWNDEDDLTVTTNYAYNAAPYNNGGGSNGCYNGGSWTMEKGTAGETESVVHVRLAGYSVNFGDANPNYAANGTQTGVIGNVIKNSYVKAFSAGYVQLLYPIDESKVTKNGYLSIAMEGAVTGTKAESISHSPAVSGNREGDLDNLKKYFGVDSLDDLQEGLATGEVFYQDNYSDNQFGTYVMRGGGNADSATKNNYFLTSTQGVLSGQEGNASTPLMSTVYIGGDVRFSSRAIRTDDESDAEHYIKPEEFNTQTDNKVEYNYMTAMNILQKFDADAYTPLGGANAVIGQNYNFDSINIGNFVISTSETATSWSSTKTKNAKLSILYGAKPDGRNWEKKLVTVEGGDADKTYDDGGVADMDGCREENLIYFTTLQELYDYFGGPENGKCVAILYELRDCCIRTGRTVTARAGMQVNSDFELTGNTYCTTNDVRLWSNYRPVYKEYFTKYYNSKSEEERAKFDALLYTFTWESVSGETRNGVTSRGRGLTDMSYNGANGKGQAPGENDGYQAYFETEKKAPEGTEKATTLRPGFAAAYWDGYIKSQYAKGVKKAGTHNGWFSGNTLLINTLEPDISIYGADYIEGSGGASGKARKSSYNVSNGERVAKFEVEPSLGIAGGLDDHYLVSTGSLSTGISIELKLPKKLTYREGSVRIDYSDKECGYREGELEWTFEEKENADGSTTLYLYTNITDIHRKLPEIFFETFIGDLNPLSEEKEVTNGETLEVKASITPVYGKENQLAAKSNSDSCKIKIVKTVANGAYITTDTPLGELGDEMVYNLHYSAKDAANTVEFVDILPYNGDGRETKFDGGYRVSRIEITFTNEADYKAYIEEARGELRYKTEQRVPAGSDTLKDRNKMRDDMRSGTQITGSTMDSGKYVVTYDIEELAKNDPELLKAMLQTDGADSAGALYIKVPQVSQKNGFTVKIVLTPRDTKDGMIAGDGEKVQSGNNVYGDSFFYSTGDGDTNTIPTSNAFIRLIGRYISGMVWMDQDNDGKYVAGTTKNPSNDRVMEGVDVKLYRVVDNADGTKSYESAKDAYGADVETVKTDKDGRYQFENLAPGTYIASFTNDASNDGVKDNGDYHIKKGAADAKPSVTPISFGRLSVTRLDSTSVRSSNYNYTKPYYGEELDGAEGPAALDAAYLYQEISLPEAKNIQTTPYVSGNWNAGLYYIDQSIVKNWNNMTEYDLEKEYGVAFAVTGTYGGSTENGADAPAESAESFTLEYVMAGKGAKTNSVTVTGSSSAAKAVLQEGEALDYTTFSASAAPTDLSGGAETQTYTWSLQNLALQAEGRSGKISYEVEEAKAYEITGALIWKSEKDLKGFITETESTGEGTTTGTFTAHNTQVLYDIDVRKIGELIGMKDYDSGIIEWKDELSDVTQKGAKFGIYKAASCGEKDLLKEVEIQEANESVLDAVGSFTAMPGGTYYVKEMTPPLFYELNEAVFKLEISYPESSETDPEKADMRAVPAVCLTKLEKDQKEQDITKDLTVDGKAASEPVELKDAHVLSFAVEDQLVTGIVQIHKTDGERKALEGVTFTLERQDGKEIEEESRVLTGTTDEAGMLTFTGLKPGIYVLTETATAAGDDGQTNMLLGEPVTITLPHKMSKPEAEDAGIRTEGEDVVTEGGTCYYYSLNYEITNEAVLTLPETGGTAGAIPAMAATALLLAGGYLFIRRRKKGNA